MAERGIEVDHSSVHRWVIKLLPVFEKAFRKRKRPVGKSWRVDETYVKVKGQWKYLYRAVDKAIEAAQQWAFEWINVRDGIVNSTQVAVSSPQRGIPGGARAR
ncbi:transposase-like protein [Paraburkholderia graminis]|nr:transposase-like protein [Paraburkholderia graminis]